MAIKIIIEHDREDVRPVVQKYVIVCSAGDWISDMSEDQAEVLTHFDEHIKITNHTHFYRYLVERNKGRDESAMFKRR